MDPPAVLKVKVEAQFCYPAFSVRCTPVLCVSWIGNVVAVFMNAAHVPDFDALPERYPLKLSKKLIDNVNIWPLKVVPSGSGSI